MSTRIRFRRDTAANWTTNNPTLTTGELGYETNTGKFKIGNNTNAWTALPYSITAELAEGNLDNLKDVTITSAADGDFLRWNASSSVWINDAVNLATDTVGSYVTSLVAGTGVTLSNNSGEGATPTVAVDTAVIQARVTDVSDTEIGYLNGVTSAIQTQIDTKAPSNSPTFTGTVTVPTPTNSTDAVTKSYADAITQSLDIKDSVRVASTANITIASALTNGSTIDGVVVATGNRVLLKNQTTASQNGIYVVVASGAASRSTDADTSAKVTTGMYVFVSEGTVSADMGYVLTTNDAITLGTTALSFTQFSGAGQITAGSGIIKNGNELSVDATVFATVVSPAFSGTVTSTNPQSSDDSDRVATTQYVKQNLSAITLDSLFDVDAPSPAAGTSLMFDGTEWVPANPSLDDLSLVSGTSGAATGDLLKYDGADWTPGRASLDELSDVTAASPSVNDILKWDGSAWVAAAAAAADSDQFLIAGQLF